MEWKKNKTRSDNDELPTSAMKLIPLSNLVRNWVPVLKDY